MEHHTIFFFFFFSLFIFLYPTFLVSLYTHTKKIRKIPVHCRLFTAAWSLEISQLRSVSLCTAASSPLLVFLPLSSACNWDWVRSASLLLICCFCFDFRFVVLINFVFFLFLICCCSDFRFVVHIKSVFSPFWSVVVVVVLILDLF